MDTADRGGRSFAEDLPRINPALPTDLPEFPTVEAIVDTDGLPTHAVIRHAIGSSAVAPLRAQMHVIVIETPEDTRLFSLCPESFTEFPTYPKSGKTRWVAAFGEVRTVSSWALDSRCVVSLRTLLKRLQAGWESERALTHDPSPGPKQRRRILYRHSTGQWAKRIRGTVYYFGAGSYERALSRYEAERTAIEAGRPEDRDRNPTVKDLANRFLAVKQREVESGELGKRSFLDYKAALELLLRATSAATRVSGLTPTRFRQIRDKLQEGRAAVTLSNLIRRISVFLNWVNKQQICDRIETGPDWRPPRQTVIRREQLEQEESRGLRMFTASEVQVLLQEAKHPLRTMILLGLNCGMGNTDCSELPMSALHLDERRIEYPRPKTLVYRQCPLWPETIQSLRESIAARPDSRDPADDNRVFLTRYGRPWVRVTGEVIDDAIGKAFAKLLQATGLKRPGVNFYALRHTFQTVADEVHDDAAVKLIMGHVDASMSARYRQQFPEARLREVVDYVRKSLLLSQQAQQRSATAGIRLYSPGAEAGA